MNQFKASQPQLWRAHNPIESQSNPAHPSHARAMPRPAPANHHSDRNPNSALSPTLVPNVHLPPHPRPRKYPHPAPTRRVSHLGPAGGLCGGGGRLGQLMLKGANCHREGGRRPGQLQTLPWPHHTHRKSRRLESFNTRTPDPQQRHITVRTDIRDEMDSPQTVPFFYQIHSPWQHHLSDATLSDQIATGPLWLTTFGMLL